MSRIGQQPIVIPAGVDVKVEGKKVLVKGPLGQLGQEVPACIDVKVNNGKIEFVRDGDEREQKSQHGLIRTLTANMVLGVTKGYTSELEIQGVGFKASIQGQKIVISLGYSSPIEYMIPEGVKIAVDANGVNLVVKGCDKQKVGEVAARIKSFYPVEPYKGKGIRYKNQYVRRKEGKTVA